MVASVLTKELEKNRIEYKRDFSLKNSSTFKIGGVCRLAIFPKNTEELALSVSLLDAAEKEFHVAGRGSNTLFFDGYIDKVIIFTSGVNSTEILGTDVIAECGAPIMPLCARLADAGLSGLEFACGIPGSVGGAIFMNAGAHGGAVSDVVRATRAYDRESGSIITLTEHGFDYRKSVYSQNKSLVCLGAKFGLTLGEPSEIHASSKTLLESRRQKQPLEYPSAGSYFKRPVGDFAGRLIEVSGLKGARVGGAEVSEKHAGFIVNKGGATFDDVMRLEELVRESVLSNTGVVIEREVEIVR